MNTIESLLSEHKIITDQIVSEYFEKYKEAAKLNPEQSAKSFFQSTDKEFRKKIAQAGATVLHKSIVEGVEKNAGETHYELVAGVKRINLESVQNLMAALLKK